MLNKEQIYNLIHRLYYAAQYENAGDGCNGTYKWEIGIDIMSLLHEDLTHYAEPEYSYSKLMGIKIGNINYSDPECIKLWKEIK